MKKLILSAATAGALALFAMAGPVQAQQGNNDQLLFGVTFFQNQLITIDTTTGEGTLVGNIGEAVSGYGLAVYQGKLYTFNSHDNTIDQLSMLTGRILQRKNIGLTDVAGEGDLAIRSDTGIGFIASTFDGQGNPTHPLYVFDLNANTPTVEIAQTPVALDALAFDGNHTLYAVSQGDASNDATLYTVNQLTGGLTSIGTLGVAKNSPVAGITFAADGTFYGAIDDQLFRINKSTGAATLVDANTPDFSFSSVSGVAFATGASALANMSSRANVGVGDNVLIGGFIIRQDPALPPGSAPAATHKMLALRAIGPSISVDGQPVAGTLADPTLSLYNSAGTRIKFNDNWKGNTSADQTTIVDSGLAPANDNESVIIANLTPGRYTAIVSGAGNGTGIALEELYDLESGNGLTQINLSARGFVETGDNVLIAGVIVAGSKPQSVIVRGIGPSLPSAQIPNRLANPTLDLYDGNGNLLERNDNWQDSPEAQDISNAHLAPPSMLESAIEKPLLKGNYTAVLRGVGNTSGVALVEVYIAP